MNATTRHNLTGAAFTAFGVALTALGAVPAVAAAWYTATSAARPSWGHWRSSARRSRPTWCASGGG